MVVLLRDKDLEFYRERLAGSGVICEPVLLDRALAQLKGTRLGPLAAAGAHPPWPPATTAR